VLIIVFIVFIEFIVWADFSLLFSDFSNHFSGVLVGALLSLLELLGLLDDDGAETEGEAFRGPGPGPGTRRGIVTESDRVRKLENSPPSTDPLLCDTVGE
jgi:hypothetical protein